MAIEIVDLPMENGGSFHSYVTAVELWKITMLLMGRSTNINIYQLFLWPFSIAFCMFTRPGIINHKCDLQPPGANPKAKLGQYPAVDPRRCLKRSWSMKKWRSNSLPHEFRCTREHTKISLFWT